MNNSFKVLATMPVHIAEINDAKPVDCGSYNLEGFTPYISWGRYFLVKNGVGVHVSTPVGGKFRSICEAITAADEERIALSHKYISQFVNSGLSGEDLKQKTLLLQGVQNGYVEESELQQFTPPPAPDD